VALKDSIADLIRPAVESAGFFLEDVFTSNPGNHRIVTCMVDGLKPLSLDEVTVVSMAPSLPVAAWSLPIRMVRFGP
jgi:ribosome maturation factor RimP